MQDKDIDSAEAAALAAQAADLMASAHAAAVEEANNQFSEQSPGQHCALLCFVTACANKAGT